MNNELLRNGSPEELVETLVREMAVLTVNFAKLTRKAQELHQHVGHLEDKLEEALKAAKPMTLAERGKHKALQMMYDAALEEIKRLSSSN